MPKPTKLAIAKMMAAAHVKVDPSVQVVYLLQSVPKETSAGPIKLLEVVEGTIERGIEPVHFAADPGRGYDYPSLIVDVSPAEYASFGRKRFLRFKSEKWEIGRKLAERN